jgi:ribosome-binding protein aMBF1 (putative translation factor)
MPKPKPTLEDLRERKLRRVVWREFRRVNLFTQKKLAERLKISLRTVQAIEGTELTPIPDTRRRFAELKALFDRERKRANGGAG